MKSVTTFEAKNRLSELLASANRGKPQLITKNGVETAVIISYEEYRKLVARRRPLVEFMLDSPLRGADIDLERSKDTRDRPTIDFDDPEYL